MTKMGLGLFLALGLAMGGARAGSLPDLEQMGSVALYSAGEVKHIDHRFSYPGMGASVEDSQLSNHWNTPDCLILNGSFGGPTPKDKVRELASRLEVFDGAGVLFNDGHGDVNPLPARQIKGTYVYFLKDLSKYVTGIRVQMKNGETVAHALRDIFGDSHHNLVLTLSRGCDLLRRDF